jgi:hypothetical protein
MATSKKECQSLLPPIDGDGRIPPLCQAPVWPAFRGRCHKADRLMPVNRPLWDVAARWSAPSISEKLGGRMLREKRHYYLQTYSRVRLEHPVCGPVAPVRASRLRFGLGRVQCKRSDDPTAASAERALWARLRGRRRKRQLR